MLMYFIMLFVIIILIMLSKRINNSEKKFLICTYIVLVFISGFRNYNVGVDTKLYSSFFEYAKNISYSNLHNVRYEYGFALFCKLLSTLNNNYHYLLFATSAFINYAVLNFIKKNSKNVYFSVIMYILCNFFFSYMNVMRQAIAISIILLNYESLKKEKYLKFSIGILFAMLFHTSAILCFT